jgi:hypothetical protein
LNDWRLRFDHPGAANGQRSDYYTRGVPQRRIKAKNGPDDGLHPNAPISHGAGILRRHVYPASQALLRQICVSCNVRVRATHHLDPEPGCKVWTMIATRGKETWTTFHEDRYKAACALAEMVGFEVEDG